MDQATSSVSLQVNHATLDHAQTHDDKPTEQKLTRLQKLAYGVGHVLNDLCANCWFSYLLIYFIRVVGLTNAQAGMLLLIGQATDACFTPLDGVIIDRTRISFYGKRKFWHIVGTVSVLLSFPFIFNPCFLCADGDSGKVLYYGVFVGIFQFGWGIIQISHLSLIPVIMKTDSDKVQLNAIRSGMTFVCGVLVFALTWLLLGASEKNGLGPGDAKEFMYLAVIVCIMGVVFTILFHVGTFEERSVALKKCEEEYQEKNLVRSLCSPRPGCSRSETDSPLMEPIKVVVQRQDSQTCSWKAWFKMGSFYKVGLVYTCTRLAMNAFQSFFVIYLTETLGFGKDAIAYFPLLLLIVGALASCLIQPLAKKASVNIMFLFGCVLLIVASVMIFLITKDQRDIAYGAAILAGGGFSIMLVTSLAMIADIIGDQQDSAAFVYSAMSFVDKISTGLVIAGVQALKPAEGEGESSIVFTKMIQAIIPGSCATVAALIVGMGYITKYKCTRKVKTENKEIQTSWIHIPEDADNNNNNDNNTIKMKNIRMNIPAISISSFSTFHSNTEEQPHEDNNQNEQHTLVVDEDIENQDNDKLAQNIKQTEEAVPHHMPSHKHLFITNLSSFLTYRLSAPNLLADDLGMGFRREHHHASTSKLMIGNT